MKSLLIGIAEGARKRPPSGFDQAAGGSMGGAVAHDTSSDASASSWRWEAVGAGVSMRDGDAVMAVGT
jgi:hypothetical protein